MGMHIGLVAVEASIDQFVDQFTRVWPKFEVVDMANELGNADALWAWKESHAERVPGAEWSKENPGREVFGFWQEGRWACMMDESYVLASDEEGLSRLSQQVGRVVSFVVETVSGCAEFWCFEAGGLRRRIWYHDGDVSTVGEPLPEEAGIDVRRYYMQETESLWKAFGLTPYIDEGTPRRYQAICVVDRTDYGELLANSPFQAAKKPWWKIW